MGFFFLLAGYFTPARSSAKATRDSSATASRRLGIPLLAFILMLGPLTAAMVDAARRQRLLGVFPYLWNHASSLTAHSGSRRRSLIFCLGYCAWRATFGPSLAIAAHTTSSSHVSPLAA